jgi:hypothetical protein
LPTHKHICDKHTYMCDKHTCVCLRAQDTDVCIPLSLSVLLCPEFLSVLVDTKTDRDVSL